MPKQYDDRDYSESELTGIDEDRSEYVKNCLLCTKACDTWDLEKIYQKYPMCDKCFDTFVDDDAAIKYIQLNYMV